MKAARIAFEFACILGMLAAVVLTSPWWLTKLVMQWHAARRANALRRVVYRDIPCGEKYVVTRHHVWVRRNVE